MAAGLPVVALHTDGLTATLSDETALFVSTKSVESVITGLADAMLRLARDPALRARMGDAGRERVRERFLWGTKLDEMQRCYDRVVAQDGVRML
jgi:glycosyltransferase involved in cell wall biosynthesis